MPSLLLGIPRPVENLWETAEKLWKTRLPPDQWHSLSDSAYSFSRSDGLR